MTSAPLIAPPSSGRRALTAVGSFLLRRGPLLLFALLIVAAALGSPIVLSVSNVNASLVQAAPVAVVAFGFAVVVMGGGDDAVAGGVDLSIPGTAALGTVIVSVLLTNQGWTLLPAFAVALLASLFVGAINAMLITLIGLTPILATLATYVSAIGVVRVIGQNRRVDVTDPSILALRDGDLFGIPNVVVVLIVIAAGMYFLMHRTAFGRRVQAVGGSRDAALTSGIRVTRLLGSTYVIAAATGALAAVLLVARGSGSSPGIDERLLVDMVLAAYIGAAFSPRSVVTIPGALLGAVLVAFMSNALILNRIANSWIDGYKGALILIVVATAALQNRGKR